MAKGCVLLLSGGVDSALCLAMEARKRNNPIHPIFFDYAQLQEESEFQSVLELSDWAHTWNGGSHPNSVRLPDLWYSKSGEVYNRNLIMLSMAANYARKLELWHVVSGIRSTPRYADCTPMFIEVVTGIIKASSGVNLEFPIFYLPKRKVFQECAKLDVPIHLCHSCICSNVPCGECPSCLDVKRYGPKSLVRG